MSLQPSDSPNPSSNLNLSLYHPSGAGLLPYDRALAIIEQTDEPAELLVLHDQANALAKLLKARRRLDRRVDRQNEASELKLRAERKLGRLLSPTAERGRWSRDESTGKMRGAERTLPEGITPQQSYRWRRCAVLPPKEFRAWLVRTRQAQEEITQAGLLREVEAHIRRKPAGVKLNGIDGDGSGLEPDADDANDEVATSEGSGEVRLLFSISQARTFHGFCRRLREVYDTAYPSTTVLEALRREVEAQS